MMRFIDGPVKQPGGRRPLVVLAALILVLAACGGGETAETTATTATDTTETTAADTTTSAAAETTTTTAAPVELTEITIMLGGHAMSWAPTYIAEAMGYFEEEGVSAEIVSSPEGAPAAIAAVVSQSVFMAESGAAGQIAAIIEGAPVKWAIVSANGLAPELCASPEWLAEKGIDESSPLEDKLAALPGSRLNVFQPGDNLEQVYRFLWAVYELGNIDTDGTEILSLSNIAGSLAALAQGSVDVIASTPPGCSQAEAQGIGETFLRPMAEVEALRVIPASVGMINNADIEARPELVKAVIRALYRGNQLLIDDPEAAREILRAQFADTSEEDFEAIWQEQLAVRVPETMVIGQEQWDAFVEFRELQGSDVGDVTYEDAVLVDLTEEAIAEVEARG